MKQPSRSRARLKVIGTDPFEALRAMDPPAVEHHVIEQKDGNRMDPLAMFMKRAAWNIQVARQKRQEALHLKVKVGAVVSGSMPNGDYVEAITANQNLGEGSGPLKKCAEQQAINRLARLGVVVIHGMVVVGDHQPDAQSGIQGVTLQPCGECRNHATEHKLVPDDAPILSASPLQDIYEIHDLAELNAVHSGELAATDPDRYRVDSRFEDMRRSVERYNPYATGLVGLESFASPADLVRQTLRGELEHLSLAA